MSNGVVVVALGVLGGLLMCGVLVGVFAYLYGRHRVFSRGLHSTAVVIDVQTTPVLQRRSAIEAPTEVVTVATAARPRGIRVNQKFPAGQYRVGEVVPVVQSLGNPDRLYLDRPDLERSAWSVYSPLALLVVVPLIVVLGIRGLTRSA